MRSAPPYWAPASAHPCVRIGMPNRASRTLRVSYRPSRRHRRFHWKHSNCSSVLSLDDVTSILPPWDVMEVSRTHGKYRCARGHSCQAVTLFT